MAFAFDNALFALDSAQGAETAQILGARQAVPARFDSWDHSKKAETRSRPRSPKPASPIASTSPAHHCPAQEPKEQAT